MAAAGVIGGVGGAVGRTLGVQPLSGPGADTTIGNHLRLASTSGAAAIAGAATRSVLTGTDFGDNLIAVLPDVIGSTIGNALANGVIRAAEFYSQVSMLENAGISTEDAKFYVRQLGNLSRGDINGFLDQGGGGGSSIYPVTEAEKRAYNAALTQTGDVTDAQTAVLATALRERLDIDAARIRASAMLSATAKEGFFRFKGAIDQALISTEVYFDRSIPEMLPSGYRRLSGAEVHSLGFNPTRLVDTTSGYFAVLYAAPGGNYIYANRGTDTAVDWKSNALQGIGQVAQQYDLAIQNARDLSKSLGTSLSFTGHSLGGGLATAQALITGLHASVFDPAGVHPSTLARYRTDFSRANELVTSYYVSGEFLHGFNERSGVPTRGSVIALPAVDPLSRNDMKFYSAPTTSLGGVALHSTDALLSSMYYRYATGRKWP